MPDKQAIKEKVDAFIADHPEQKAILLEMLKNLNIDLGESQ